MKRVIKRVFPIILCLVLMFCLFATPLTVPKADAIAITASGVTIAVISSLLAALGISFASVDATQQASQGFYASMTDGSSAKEFIDNLVSLNANPPPEYNGSGEQFNKVLLNIANNAGLVAFYESAKNFFGGGSTASGNVGVISSDYCCVGNIVVNKIGATEGDSSAFTGYFGTVSSFTGAPYTTNDKLSYSCGGINYLIHAGIKDNNACVFVSQNGGDSIGYVISGVDLSEYTDYQIRYGFVYVTRQLGGDYIQPYVTLYYLHPSDGKHYVQFSSFWGWDKYRSILITGSNAYYDDITYTNETEFPWQNIIELISDYTSQGKEVTFDYTETLNAIQNQNQELLQNQRELLQQNADILAELEKLNNPTTDPGTDPETKPEGEGEGDLNVPKLPSLADKFPFCVPFDLIHLIQNLNATPKAPHWEIPFGFGLEEPYVIDIDFSDFEVLAAPIRWFCVIAFILGLILITRKIIQG